MRFPFSAPVSTHKKGDDMKIKYIKDAPRGVTGTLDDVTEFEGNILISIGLAEMFDDTEATEATEPTEPTEPKAKPKPKAKSKASATVTDDGTKPETDSE